MANLVDKGVAPAQRAASHRMVTLAKDEPTIDAAEMKRVAAPESAHYLATRHTLEAQGAVSARRTTPNHRWQHLDSSQCGSLIARCIL